jgi:REP element-mobilizing transposase RayT
MSDGMGKKRWIAAWKDSVVKPAFYHCISRVVDRKRVFGPDEKEKFRTFMRMQENFTGCRVIAYCFMCNHIHVLVEVPPMPVSGLSDEELLGRLRAIYQEAEVALVAAELADARKSGVTRRVSEIHLRYTYRMHDLSEFMKTLMQRFTKWFNRTHGRTGNLWEDAFKSVIVEDGVAAKSIAAYIDLNPVRAGMVKDPSAYRWSSYGEAIGGGPKGNGKRARSGLVRALRAHRGCGADASLWANDVSREYRLILMAGAAEKLEAHIGRGGREATRHPRKGISAVDAKREVEQAEAKQGEISLSRMLQCRVRYFTDGAVIGSRSFVNEAFLAARERFGAQRKDGARKLRGNGAGAAGTLWSARDLKKGIG